MTNTRSWQIAQAFSHAFFVNGEMDLGQFLTWLAKYGDARVAEAQGLTVSPASVPLCEVCGEESAFIRHYPDARPLHLCDHCAEFYQQQAEENAR